jgi:integrative and conjugative element protein (TIGR02256 family)
MTKIKRVIIEEEILSRLSIQVSKNTFEQCGILVGQLTDDSQKIKDYLLDDSPVEQSRYGITRSKKIWKKLNNYARFNPPYDYIGEWHSHPFGSVEPSTIDMESMKNVLNSKNYGNIDRVLLLIISNRQKYSIYKFYKTKERIEIESLELNIITKRV